MLGVENVPAPGGDLGHAERVSSWGDFLEEVCWGGEGGDSMQGSGNLKPHTDNLRVTMATGGRLKGSYRNQRAEQSTGQLKCINAKC